MVVPNEKILHFVYKKTLIWYFEKKICRNCQKGGSLRTIKNAFYVKRLLSIIDQIGK
jgi:hypothetical protein